MNLVIDIGNTVVKIAVFGVDEQMIEVVYASTEINHEWRDFISKFPIDKAIVSSVIALPAAMLNYLSSLSIPVLYMNAETTVPIVNLYKTPKTLGCDRLAAVVGANFICPGNNLLVIDAGTCITYDFIDSDGRYHGGNISPGLDMRFKALHHFTGKLPMLDTVEETLPLGQDTTSAIRAGVWRGIEYEIDGYIRQLTRKYSNLFIVLTGGNAFSFDDSVKSIIFADRFLVLKGLNRILNFNNGSI